MWAPIVAVFFSSPAVVLGQFLSTSSIGGTVADETGSVLPGVLVTAKSAALQVAELQTMTDSAGRYELQGLPAGVYEVKFELAGFESLVRDQLQIDAGFAARVNAALNIGRQADVIQVSASSPIVDVTTTGGGKLLSGNVLNDVIPGSRLNSELGRITPGLQGTAPPNIGLLGATAGGGFNTYGESTFRMLVDGMNLLVGTFPDQVAAREIEMRTFGNGPDIATSGSIISVVTKSGGNDFHGRLEEQYQTDALQSNNLHATLRSQGLQTLDSTRYYNDFNADLGGRIVRDTLWFYGAYHDRRNERTATGFVMNAGPNLTFDPNSPPFYPTVWVRQFTAKLTYQIDRRVQITGGYARDIIITDGNLGAGTPRFTPYESSTISRTGPATGRANVRVTFGDRVLFDTQAGRVKYVADYRDTPGSNDIVSRFDLATLQLSGGGISTGGSAAETKQFDARTMAQGNLTVLPQAALRNHEFKTGYRLWWQSASPGDEPNHPAGNYRLVYNTVDGVPYIPVEITTYNFPVAQKLNEDADSAYVNDRWEVGSRITLNMGVRYDRNHAWVPAQTKVQGTFGGAGTFSEVESNTWSNFAPRLGVAWDMTGSGKTVMKGTYGRYNAEMSETFAAPYNNNGVVATTYRWADPTHCDCYVPGTVDLNTNGPDFISVSGSSNNIQNPALKSPREHEVTGLIEHEVAPDVSVRGIYVYKRLLDDLTTTNTLRPYSAYDIALTLPAPSPSGLISSSSPTMTIYDFPITYRGSAFIANELVNRPDSGSDHFQTFEITLNKRQTGTWGIVTSFLATKNHRWLTSSSGTSLAVPQSPNDAYFPIDETWTMLYKMTGNSRLPYGAQVAGVFDVQKGAPGQRTAIFSTPQSGNITVRLEPFGAERGLMLREANIRLSKTLRFKLQRIQLALDILNAFNSNSVWMTSYASGPSFGAATLIQSPRILRFGIIYEF
jgi:outer membrane receptor protein involved in Fe transport